MRHFSSVRAFIQTLTPHSCHIKCLDIVTDRDRLVRFFQRNDVSIQCTFQSGGKYCKKGRASSFSKIFLRLFFRFNGFNFFKTFHYSLAFVCDGDIIVLSLTHLLFSQLNRCRAENLLQLRVTQIHCVAIFISFLDLRSPKFFLVRSIS